MTATSGNGRGNAATRAQASRSNEDGKDPNDWEGWYVPLFLLFVLYVWFLFETQLKADGIGRLVLGLAGGFVVLALLLALPAICRWVSGLLPTGWKLDTIVFLWAPIALSVPALGALLLGISPDDFESIFMNISLICLFFTGLVWGGTLLTFGIAHLWRGWMGWVCVGLLIASAVAGGLLEFSWSGGGGSPGSSHRDPAAHRPSVQAEPPRRAEPVCDEHRWGLDCARLWNRCRPMRVDAVVRRGTNRAEGLSENRVRDVARTQLKMTNLLDDGEPAVEPFLVVLVGLVGSGDAWASEVEVAYVRPDLVPDESPGIGSPSRPAAVWGGDSLTAHSPTAVGATAATLAAVSDLVDAFMFRYLSVNRPACLAGRRLDAIALNPPQ